MKILFSHFSRPALGKTFRRSRRAGWASGARDLDRTLPIPSVPRFRYSLLLLLLLYLQKTFSCDIAAFTRSIGLLTSDQVRYRICIYVSLTCSSRAPIMEPSFRAHLSMKIVWFRETPGFFCSPMSYLVFFLPAKISNDSTLFMTKRSCIPSWNIKIFALT